MNLVDPLDLTFGPRDLPVLPKLDVNLQAPPPPNPPPKKNTASSRVRAGT